MSFAPMSSFKRIFPVLATLFPLLVLFIRDLDLLPKDFAIYLKSLERLTQELSPYQTTDEHPFKYAPGTLLFFQLLPENAQIAWWITKLLSLTGLCAVLWSMSYSLTQVSYLIRLAIGFALAWKGLLECLDYGQLEILLLSLFYFAFFSIEKKPILSALALSIAALFKIHWGLLALPLIMIIFPKNRKRGVTFLSSLFGFSLVFSGIVPLLYFGPEKLYSLYVEWFHILKIQPSWLYISPENQSLWAVSLKTSSPPLAWIGSFLAVVTSIGVTYKAKLNRRDSKISLVLLWLLTLLLVSPLSWRWSNLILILLPFSTFYALFKMQNVYAKLSMSVLILLYAIQQNPIARILGFSSWKDFHQYFLITLLWLFVYLVLIFQFVPIRFAIRFNLGKRNTLFLWISMSLMGVSFWFKTQFGPVSIEQVLYHLQFQAQGLFTSDHRFIWTFFREVILWPSIILFFILILFQRLRASAFRLYIKYPIAILNLIVVLLLLNQLGLPAFIEGLYADDFLKEHYIFQITPTSPLASRPKALF